MQSNFFLQELDDRGLLDGGGSLPSYNTSLKNKNRRTLELQSRSNRLQGRGKEVKLKRNYIVKITITYMSYLTLGF